MKFLQTCMVIALCVSTVLGTHVQNDEINPSCLDASRVNVFRGFGHKIESTIRKFDRARDRLGLKRNINWDGPAVFNQLTGTEADLAGDLFLNGAGERQIIFSEPLTASRDSFKSAFDGKEVGANAFSPVVNVAPLNGNRVTVSFTLKDKVTAGLVNGFGVIFTDVETHESAGLVFYDSTGNEITRVWAKKLRNGESQFLGALFDETVVAQVGIVMGNNGNIDNYKPEGKKGNDFVVVDDWFFFLSDTEVPTVTYRGFVKDRQSDRILRNFERRRVALDQDQIQNINWDGGAVTALTQGGTAALPRDLFLLKNGARQLTIAAANEKVFASENEFGHEENFGFESFTPNVNFASNGKTITIEFFLKDGHTPGLIHGCGFIFTDVEDFEKSGMRAYDSHGKLLSNVRARPGKNGQSQFIGVMFNSPKVAKVVLDMGDNEFLEDPSSAKNIDVVVVDDWLFFKSVTKA